MSDISRQRERASADSNARYLRRRKSIIAAAGDVFHAKGLADTSLLDISGRLGVNRASVYYYFKSKHDLFRAVIHDSIHAIVSDVKSIAARPGPQRPKISEILARVVHAYEDSYPTLHVYLQEDMRRISRDQGAAEATDAIEAARMAALADDYMVVLEDLVARGVESGEFRDLGDPHVVAQVMQGTVNWMHRWFTPSDGPSTDEVASILVELIMGGLAVER